MGIEVDNYPRISRASHEFGEGLEISAILLEFENVHTVFIYQGAPRTGSRVLVTDDGLSTYTLFAGKHEAEAEALGRVFARKIGKGISMSVYFESNFRIPVDGFTPLIDKLLEAYRAPSKDSEHIDINDN